VEKGLGVWGCAFAKNGFDCAFWDVAFIVVLKGFATGLAFTLEFWLIVVENGFETGVVTGFTTGFTVKGLLVNSGEEPPVSTTLCGLPPLFALSKGLDWGRSIGLGEKVFVVNGIEVNVVGGGMSRKGLFDTTGGLNWNNPRSLEKNGDWVSTLDLGRSSFIFVGLGKSLMFSFGSFGWAGLIIVVVGGLLGWDVLFFFFTVSSFSGFIDSVFSSGWVPEMDACMSFIQPFLSSSDGAKKINERVLQNRRNSQVFDDVSTHSIW